jgi:hypothetical protein
MSGAFSVSGIRKNGAMYVYHCIHREVAVVFIRLRVQASTQEHASPFTSLAMRAQHQETVLMRH